VLEKSIETYFRTKATRLGWRCYKFTSDRGVPDRIVVSPGGIFFVEFKAPGKKPSKIQEYQHKKLRDLGATVYVIDSKEGCDGIIQRELAQIPDKCN
jgi:hypothetical protein